jgi:hypothetical protein
MYFAKRISVLVMAALLLLSLTSVSSISLGILYDCWPSEEAFEDAESACIYECEVKREMECQDAIPWLYWCSGGDCICKWQLVCGPWPGLWLDYWTVDVNHPDC